MVLIINKTFKYRIYPNKTTISRLNQWNYTLKCLWNLANEQRKLGYGRPNGEKIYPSSFDQQKELTQLRKEFDWMNDVPRHVCAGILNRLDKAWRMCFERISSEPKWKKKSDYVSLSESDPKKFSINGNRLKFPKLPPIPIVMSRPLGGKPKSCTIKRDGDQWFACIMCEIETESAASRTGPKIGIDRGIINVISDSRGRLVENPRHFNKSMRKLARAQRILSRRMKGSNNQQKAKNRVMRISRTIRRQREHFLHVESSNYSKSHGIIVLEKLNTAGMIRSRLARHIADAGWGMFASMLLYKLNWSGGNLYLVDPKYTSQTCSSCGNVDRNSRNGEKFKCIQCGFECHSDTNASINILRRWSPALKPVETTSHETRQRSRKFGSKKLDLVD